MHGGGLPEPRQMVPPSGSEGCWGPAAEAPAKGSWAALPALHRMRVVEPCCLAAYHQCQKCGRPPSSIRPCLIVCVRGCRGVLPPLTGPSLGGFSLPRPLPSSAPRGRVRGAGDTALVPLPGRQHCTNTGYQPYKMQFGILRYFARFAIDRRWLEGWEVIKHRLEDVFMKKWPTMAASVFSRNVFPLRRRVQGQRDRRLRSQ